MNGVLPALAFAVLATISTPDSVPAKPCADPRPPATFVVKQPYPFQNGTERTFYELYHGTWKVRSDLSLVAKPRTSRRVATIKAGTVVEAVIAESIVVHPLRFVASHETELVFDCTEHGCKAATMPKGDAFWVLESAGEGGFAIWWHCGIYSWDSTEEPQDSKNRLELLGANEEDWVNIRDPETGQSGWFKQVPQDGPQLEPAEPTTKDPG